MIMEKFLTLSLPVNTGTATGPTPVGDVNGTITSVVVDTVTDTNADFVSDGVSVDDVVVNVDTNAYALVTNVAATALTLDSDIFLVASQKYRVMDESDAFTLTDSAATFTSTVAVGDVVLNGSYVESTVVTIDSDTQLTLSAPIISTLPSIPDADTYFIYSEGDNDGDRLFNISGIATVAYMNSIYCTVSYMDRKVGGGLSQVSIYHTTDTSAQEFHNTLNNALVSAYETNWRDVTTDLVLPQGMRATIIM